MFLTFSFVFFFRLNVLKCKYRINLIRYISFFTIRILHAFVLIWNLLYNYSKDVRLPVQLQRAMAAEAEAAREARAKVTYHNSSYQENSILILCVLINTIFDSLGHCGRRRTKSVEGVKRGSKCDCWKLFCSTGIYYWNLLVTAILWIIWYDMDHNVNWNVVFI